MHKALAGAVLALTLVGVVDAAAIDRRVRVNNETSYDIVRFYASNTGTNSWEEDILGEDILPAGYSVTINIDDGSGYCKYDFLAIFEDGDQVEAHNKNVCDVSEFSFTD
jgi:hypothetical protein